MILPYNTHQQTAVKNTAYAQESAEICGAMRTAQCPPKNLPPSAGTWHTGRKSRGGVLGGGGWHKASVSVGGGGGDDDLGQKQAKEKGAWDEGLLGERVPETAGKRTAWEGHAGEMGPTWITGWRPEDEELASAFGLGLGLRRGWDDASESAEFLPDCWRMEDGCMKPIRRSIPAPRLSLPLTFGSNLNLSPPSALASLCLSLSTALWPRPCIASGT